nr:reverse transcriptase domain-containing protein [Tanacetum cinerariifolium]
LAAYEATRAANALEAESQSQNGSDGDNGNGGNRNGGNRKGRYINPNENDRGARPVARECIYQYFMKCQPLNFKGIEGVVGLIRWFEKMETVFHISNFPEQYQVKEDEEEFKVEVSRGGMMEIVIDPFATGDISEPTGGYASDLEGTLYDMSYYKSEVPLDRITKFETAQRQLEAGQLVASGERAGLADRVRSLGQENLRVRALLCIERDHVDNLRYHMALSQKEFCQDRDDTRSRLRRLESLVERRFGFRRYLGSIMVK